MANVRPWLICGATGFLMLALGAIFWIIFAIALLAFAVSLLFPFIPMKNTAPSPAAGAPPQMDPIAPEA